MTTATETNAWFIRPITTPTGLRKFLPVAKLAGGEEVEVYENSVRSFDSVRSARLSIIRKFDGGRAFPTAPEPFAYSAVRLLGRSPGRGLPDRGQPQGHPPPASLNESGPGRGCQRLGGASLKPTPFA